MSKRRRKAEDKCGKLKAKIDKKWAKELRRTKTWKNRGFPFKDKTNKIPLNNL